MNERSGLMSSQSAGSEATKRITVGTQKEVKLKKRLMRYAILLDYVSFPIGKLRLWCGCGTTTQLIHCEIDMFSCYSGWHGMAWGINEQGGRGCLQCD